ncbi:hypothetical protein Bca4012_052107 [Brassica carinata]
MSYRLDFFSPSIDFRHGYGICLHSSIVINSLINPISPLLTRSLIQYIFSLCDSTAINIGTVGSAMLLLKYQDEVTEKRQIFEVHRLFYSSCFVVRHRFGLEC